MLSLWDEEVWPATRSLVGEVNTAITAIQAPSYGHSASYGTTEDSVAEGTLVSTRGASYTYHTQWPSTMLSYRSWLQVSQNMPRFLYWIEDIFTVLLSNPKTAMKFTD